MGIEREIAKNTKELHEEVKVNLDAEMPKVAKTLAEFQNMLLRAKATGEYEFEASIDIHKYFQKDKYKPGVGYMMVENVKVYEEGMRESADQRDAETEHQRSFGKSKVTIDNMGMGHSQG